MATDVILEDYQFEPNELRISPGTEVVFRNEDSVNHTVTADDGSFESGDLAPGNTYSYTFDSPGECGYHCDYHPQMIGRIIVE
jgi:plastocyanin